MKVLDVATVTLGVLADTTDHTTKQGVSFIIDSGGYFGQRAFQCDNGTLNAYGCLFIGDPSDGWCKSGCDMSTDSDITLYNCVFQNEGVFLWSGTADIYNLQVFVAASTAGYSTLGDATITASNIVVSGCTNALEYGEGATITNLNVAGNTESIYNCNPHMATPIYLINPLFEVWSFTWTGDSNGKVYRQYEYDLTVLNGEITDFVEDANVTLSKGGVQIGTWLTNSSGQIETQTLTYGYYNSTGGDTMYDGSNPFVLTVTHEDWADYTSRFYVTEKTKMTISMQDTTTANNAAIIWSLLFGSIAFGLFLLWRKAHA